MLRLWWHVLRQVSGNLRPDGAGENRGYRRDRRRPGARRRHGLPAQHRGQAFAGRPARRCAPCGGGAGRPRRHAADRRASTLGTAALDMHTPTSHAFKDNARAALADVQLQQAMSHVKKNFIAKRAQAAARLPEFEALRDAARAIKDHTLANLDIYLEAFEAKVKAAGGHVHWCADADG